MDTLADGLQTYKHILNEAFSEILRLLPKKYKGFRELIQRKQEEVAALKDKKQTNAEKYFFIFKIATEAHIPRLSQSIIHYTEKLVAYHYLEGNCYDYTQEVGNLENIEKKSTSPPNKNKRLIEAIIEVVSDCVQLKDEMVHLQLIRCLLTLATSPNCSVHEDLLEKIMRTIIGIHCSKNFSQGSLIQYFISQLASRQPQIQDPSKHCFTQIIVEAFKRMEKNAVLTQEEVLTFQNKRKIGNSVQQFPNQYEQSADPAHLKQLVDGYVKKALTNIIDDVCIYDEKVKKINKQYAAIPDSEAQKQNDLKLIPLKSVPNVNDVDTPQYKKTSIASVNNENDIPAGKFGWCIVCRNEASNFCKDMRVPVCSKECKSKHLEEVNQIARLSAYPQQSTTNQFIRDALSIFKFLCKLSKEDPANNLNGNQLRQKVIILELILNVLETAGPAFLSKKEFTLSIQEELMPSLLENSLSTEKAVFSLSFGIVGNLISNFRENLKTEIAVFVENIFIRILESTNSNFANRIYCLRVFRKLFTMPRAVMELFVNYDCSMNQTSILENLVGLLTKIAQGKYLKQEYANLILPDQAQELSFLAIQCVGELMKGISNFVDICEAEEQEIHKSSQEQQPQDESVMETDTSVINKQSNTEEQLMDPIQREMLKKQQMFMSLQKFNIKAKVGIKSLVKFGIIEEGNPKHLAELFFKYNSQINHEKIGEIFGSPDDFNKRVLAEFIEYLQFQDIDLVNALRKYLTFFQLPGEGEQVDRILEKFGEKYSLDNPNCYKNATTSYTLSYALMMLHTSSHSAQVQEKERMTLPQFIKLVRGIDDGSDIPEEMSQGMYADIKKNPLGIHHLEASKKALEDAMNSSITKKHEMFLKETEQMFVKGKLKIQSSRDEKYIQVFSKAYTLSLLQVVWSPVFAALSQTMLDAYNIELVQDILQGYKCSIKLLGQFGMLTERETFAFELCRLTGLMTPLKMIRQKNILAIKAVLEISLLSPNTLGTSWKTVLECVSKLDNYYLIAQNLRRDIDLINNDTFISQQPQENSLPQDEIEKYNSQVILKYVDQAEIDKIFHRSNLFDGETIVEFIRCLCKLSSEELESVNNPRIFCIQRVGEVTEFNMSRVRIIWNRIWEILKVHYNLIGCHANPRVSALAIDSLKQLSVKFLQQLHSPQVQGFETKELILSCLSMMTVSRAKHLRSGWKTILRVVNLTLQEDSTQLVEIAVRITDVIMEQESLDNLLDVFGDLIHALTNQTKYKSEIVAQKSLDHLKKCIEYLVHNTLRQSENQNNGANISQIEQQQDPQQHKEDLQEEQKQNINNENSNNNSANPPNQLLNQGNQQIPQLQSSSSRKESLIVNESKKLLEGYLIPILCNFASFFSDDRPRIIVKSVSYLFESIRQYSYTFNSEFWNLVFRGVLRPLFDDMQFTFQRNEFSSSEVKKASKNASQKAFSDFVQLFSQQFEVLHPCLPDFISIIHNTIGTNQETLSTISLNSLQTFLNTTGNRLSEAEWDNIISSLKELSNICQPHDILKARLASEDFDKPLTQLLKEPLDYRKYQVKIDFQQSTIQCVIFKNMIAFIIDVFNSFSSIFTEKQIDAIAEILQEHLTFSEEFNSRIYLRFYLWKNGLNSGVESLPVLGRQEKLARSGILSISFKRYQNKKSQSSLLSYLDCSENYMKNLQDLLSELSIIAKDEPGNEAQSSIGQLKNSSRKQDQNESNSSIGNSQREGEKNLNDILKRLAIDDKKRQLKLLRYVIGNNILPNFLSIDPQEIGERIKPFTSMLISISNQNYNFDDEFNPNLRLLLTKYFEFAFSK